MSENGGTNVLGYRDLYDAIIRVETKVDQRMNSLDLKVDRLTARQDRLEGRFDAFGSILKWMGPAGVAAAVVGYLVVTGVLKI